MALQHLVASLEFELPFQLVKFWQERLLDDVLELLALLLRGDAEVPFLVALQDGDMLLHLAVGVVSKEVEESAVRAHAERTVDFIGRVPIMAGDEIATAGADTASLCPQREVLRGCPHDVLETVLDVHLLVFDEGGNFFGSMQNLVGFWISHIRRTA